jgi:hypothetical protein
VIGPVGRITIVLLIGLLSQSVCYQMAVAQAQVQMGPLNAKLAPGRKFDESSVWEILLGSQPTKATRFVKIPNWMVGKWESSGEEVSQVIDSKAGTSNPARQFFPGISKLEWGHIRDFDGNVWIAYQVPYIEHLSEGSVVLVYELDFNPSSRSVIASKRSVRMQLTSSNKIKHVTQDFDYTHYVPLGDDLHMQNRKTMFDWQGRSVGAGTLDRTYHLVGQMQEPGPKLKELFRKYQESVGENIEP